MSIKLWISTTLMHAMPLPLEEIFDLLDNVLMDSVWLYQSNKSMRKQDGGGGGGGGGRGE